MYYRSDGDVCWMFFAGDEQISKAQLRLTDIAEHLETDWIVLARHLGLSLDEIAQIQRDYHYVVEQVCTATACVSLWFLVVSLWSWITFLWSGVTSLWSCVFRNHLS